MTQDPVLSPGGRSDIGKAVAHHFAARGTPVQLDACSVDLLTEDKNDIALRHGVPVTLHAFDAPATQTHGAFIDGSPELPQIAVCCVGLMGPQAEREADPREPAGVLRSNLEGPASIPGELANRFQQRGSGTLVGVRSVAGDRARAMNYVYGAAKAGLPACLCGLRNRLAGRGVHVVTVLPGFVGTRMTEGMDLPARLRARPEEVAEAIARAVDRARNAICARRVWRLIMAIIRNIPELLFKRLEL